MAASLPVAKPVSVIVGSVVRFSRAIPETIHNFSVTRAEPTTTPCPGMKGSVILAGTEIRDRRVFDTNDLGATEVSHDRGAYFGRFASWERVLVKMGSDMDSTL
jgi:hypothetical protein